MCAGRRRTGTGSEGMEKFEPYAPLPPPPLIYALTTTFEGPSSQISLVRSATVNLFSQSEIRSDHISILSVSLVLTTPCKSIWLLYSVIIIRSCNNHLLSTFYKLNDFSKKNAYVSYFPHSKSYAVLLKYW